MYLRYPGQCEATDSAIGSVTYAPENDMPDLFLEWNEQDPVSDLEIRRNNIIYSYQGNRNPFIDNPFLATLIWNGPQANDTWSLLSNQSYNYDSIRLSTNVIKNLVHINGVYDNKFKVYIINQLGQILLESENEKTIDVSKLPNGVYLLNLIHSNGTFNTKFIKK
tara:strand:+ start:11 stop:505 length:495 start_codon:yes stop_codon:yes gene_type:complete